MNWRGREITSLHLGLTYKCTLKCLECARTSVQKQRIPDIYNTVHVDWHNYKKVINKINPYFIDLCGNWGDPIYYPDLLSLIHYIKDYKSRNHHKNIIRLHTNGSYKDEKFWKELGKILSPTDTIMFAIDGTRENFTKYRINANIESIDLGVNTLLSVENRPRLWQKTICFSYNKWKLPQIVQEAKNSKFDVIRFDWPHVSEHEWLRPDFDSKWAWKILKLAGYEFSYPKSETDIIVKGFHA